MTQLRSQFTAPLALLPLLSCLVFSGCGLVGLSRDYGGVAYPEKDSSINGLGIFMKLCNQAGSRCFVASRLSSRLDQADAIILVGDTFHPPAKEARDWLEEWLGAKAGRSVVYFGRDFGADIYYRRQTLAKVPAAQRHRAAIELSDAQMNVDTLLEREVSDDSFCRWFHLKIHEPQREVRDFTGPWADDLKGGEGQWPVRIVLEPPKPSQNRNKPKWQTPSNTKSTTTTAVRPTPVQSKKAPKSDGEDPVLYRSVWAAFDINDDKTWKAEWAKVPEVKVLLAAEDGTALVTQLTSQRYSGSRILTIVNGAPLLNGSIVEPHFRAIAHRIIDGIQPAKRIALLPYDAQGLLISNVQEEDEVAGLSVLTTWPMNMIVAHLAFLGVLICLALFPILGRPQGLRPISLSDFGQHAEAVGRMLQRTGDSRYALQIVAEYYRTVRSEAPPPWLKSAWQSTAPTEPPAGAANSNSESSA